MSYKATFTKLLGTAATALLCITAADPAHAFTWNYRFDSFADGTGSLLNSSGHGIGINSQYEMFGSAYGYNQDSGKVFFAFNSNIPLLGNSHSRAADGNIGWGDLFINLDPTKNFSQVQGTSSLLGIRFAATNDSGISGGETGVYQGVTTANVTQANRGWSSYSSYNNYVSSKQGSVELIDGMTRTEAETYLGSHGYAAIGSAQQKLGDINLLTGSELAGLGLDFGNPAGQVFGFSFDRSVLPEGDLSFVYHLMAECANDTMGGIGEIQDVPEPTAFIGLAVVGLLLGGRRSLKHRNDASLA
jgi:hypothetical protein